MQERTTGIKPGSTTVVFAIAYHRMPNGSQMHSDLVGSTRFQFAADERDWLRQLITITYLIMGDRPATRLRDRVAGRVTNGTTDRGVDRSRLGL